MRRSGEVMAMKLITSEYSIETLPPLTRKQLQHLEALAALPDRRIDVSEISEMTDEQLIELKRASYEFEH